MQNVLVASGITFYMWLLDMGKCVSVDDISVESTRLLLSTGTIHGRVYSNQCIQLSQRVLLSYQHMRKAHCICFGLFRFFIEILDFVRARGMSDTFAVFKMQQGLTR